MHTPTLRSLILILLGVCSCETQRDATEIVAVESNELGITHVTIGRTSPQGERVLTIRGLDDNGKQLGLATLRTGKVLYSYDPDSNPGEWFTGRNLDITVGEEHFPLVNPSLDSLETREPPLPSAAAFVRLSAVADALFDEAGYRFTPTDELAYAAQNSSGEDFPTNKGSPTQSCRDGSQSWHKINGGTNDGKIGNRTYSQYACRTSSGNTGCTTNCYYGPCAGTVEWAAGANPSWVFTPTSPYQTLCGWHANGVNWYPQAYTNQTLKPGVTATCGCTGCLASGMPTGASGCDSCRGLTACATGLRQYVRTGIDAGKVCGPPHNACSGTTTGCSTGVGSATAIGICSSASLGAWCTSSTVEKGKTIYTNCN